MRDLQEIEADLTALKASFAKCATKLEAGMRALEPIMAPYRKSLMGMADTQGLQDLEATL